LQEPCQREALTKFCTTSEKDVPRRAFWISKQRISERKNPRDPQTVRTPTHKCCRSCSPRRRRGRPSRRWGGCGRCPLPPRQRRRRSPASPLPAALLPPLVPVPHLVLPAEALCRATSRRQRRRRLGRRLPDLRRTPVLSLRRTRPSAPSSLRCHSLAHS
jgi:hypothetical protein